MHAALHDEEHCHVAVGSRDCLSHTHVACGLSAGRFGFKLNFVLF